MSRPLHQVLEFFGKESNVPDFRVLNTQEKVQKKLAELQSNSTFISDDPEDMDIHYVQYALLNVKFCLLYMPSQQGCCKKKDKDIETLRRLDREFQQNESKEGKAESSNLLFDYLCTCLPEEYYPGFLSILLS